jgi:hypothetical protein
VVGAVGRKVTLHGAEPSLRPLVRPH